MKKFLAVLAIAGSLVACNDSATSTEASKDSLDSVGSEKKEMIDSSADAKKAAVDSSTEMKKDAVDSLNKKDSVSVH